MSSNLRNLQTIAVTAVVSTIGIAAYIWNTGLSDESLRVLLRAGTRIAFAVFILIFIARPLHELFRTDLTRRILRQRRQLGLVFGTLMASHLGLIVWRFAPNSDVNLDSGAIVGGSVYLLIFLLFITSFDAPARLLGPRAWKVLHKVGIYAIFAVFAVTFLPQSRDQLFAPTYVPFTLLIALGALVRLWAFFAKRQRKSAA